MGFNLHSLGGLISGLPGGKESLQVINGIFNPITQVINPVFSSLGSMLSSVTNLSKNITQGLGNFMTSPSFIYILMGGLGLVAFVVISSGGPSKIMAMTPQGRGLAAMQAMQGGGIQDAMKAVQQGGKQAMETVQKFMK